MVFIGDKPNNAELALVNLLTKTFPEITLCKKALWPMAGCYIR